MIKDLFERTEKFPLNVLYFFIEIIYIIIAHFSILMFIIKTDRKVDYSVPYVNTIGDALEHIDYFRLKTKNKSNYKLLFIDQFPTSNYVKFLFDREKYVIFNEFIYATFLKFLTIFFDENRNIIKRYKIIVQKILAIYLSKINFYKKNNDFFFQINKIKKSLNKNSKLFFHRFAESHIFFSKIESRVEKQELKKKYGPFIIENAFRFSKIKKNKLFKNLKIKNKKYVCLHIRNSKEKNENLRGSQDFGSYNRIIDFFSRKKIKVVLVGSKNDSIKKFFKKNKNIIDYRNSKYQKIENDLYLANYSILFISQISGPIIYPVLFGVPFLALDVVTFEDIQLYDKSFYLPKNFYKKNFKKMKYFEIFNDSLIFKDNYFDNNKYIVKENTSLEKLIFIKNSFNKILNNDFEFNLYQNKYMKKKLNIYSNFITLKNVNRIFFDKLI